jgi:hypothetical protein
MDLARFAVLFFCYYLFIFSGNLYVIGFTWFFLLGAAKYVSFAD